MATDKSFRYLKIYEGYQKGSIFSGFTQPAYWVVNPPNPQTVNIPTGSSVNVQISVTRNSFTGVIDLSLDQLPTGVTAVFNPATLTADQSNSVLTLTATSTAVPVAGVSVAIKGVPTPQINQSLIINVTTQPYYTFGTPQLYNVTQGTS